MLFGIKCFIKTDTNKFLIKFFNLSLNLITGLPCEQKNRVN